MIKLLFGQGNGHFVALNYNIIFINHQLSAIKSGNNALVQHIIFFAYKCTSFNTPGAGAAVIR
jgi:hypothetical protein